MLAAKMDPAAAMPIDVAHVKTTTAVFLLEHGTMMEQLWNLNSEHTSPVA